MIGKPAQFQKLSNYLALKNLCLQGWAGCAGQPRVAAAPQPWAEGWNTLGVPWKFVKNYPFTQQMHWGKGMEDIKP